MLVRNATLSSAMGELPPAECQMELWVMNDADLPRARRKSCPRASPGPEWTCECGERLGAAVHPMLEVRRLPRA